MFSQQMADCVQMHLLGMPKEQHGTAGWVFCVILLPESGEDD
jgi:hypothetical protein